MIDGIIVLNEIEKFSTTGGSSPWFWLFVCAIGVLVILLIIMALTESDGFILLMAIGLSVLGGLGGSVMWSMGGQEYLDHIEYQVIIDDSVPFTEVTERYEILDKNGIIYTIKEKTADTN